MSAGEDEGPELGGDDALAAEYVLGALAEAERTGLARRAEAEPVFRALVEDWEERLAPLAAAYPSVEPPETVRRAIERRLHGEAAPAARPGMWTSVAFWRALTVASFAALAIAVAMPFAVERGGEPHRMVASLAADNSDVRYVAIYDAASGDISLSHLSGERGEARDFELWMIAGSQAPKSLGVVPAGATARMPMPPAMRDEMADGAVFAISLEPAGGSPTGSPTGPVVAAGDLRSI